MKKKSLQELNRPSIDDIKNINKRNIRIVLDNIRSMNNVGSAFRTSDGFLIDSIYLCGITAQPPHREIQKTAIGATESVNWKYFETTQEAIEQLNAEDYIVVSIEQVHNSQMLHEFEFDKKKKYAFVFGNEVKGVQQEIVDQSDAVIEIPQFGNKHSLNISVSMGMIIWQHFAKTI